MSGERRCSSRVKKVSSPDFSRLLLLLVSSSLLFLLFSLFTPRHSPPPSSHTSSLISAHPRSSPSSLSTLSSSSSSHFYFSCSLPFFPSPPLLHSASSSLAFSSFVSSPPLSLHYGLLLASSLLFTLRLSITLLPSSFSSGFNFYLAPLISSSSLSSLLLHSPHRFSLCLLHVLLLSPPALLPLISSSSASFSL